MNRYTATGIIALLILVTVLPIYAVREPGRMETAQADLRQQYLADGAMMYVENCISCHGIAGEGVGMMPALNDPNLAQVDADMVYRTIAHSPHGSTMGAWHIDRGGLLNDYQIKGLVTLIQHGDWAEVGKMANQLDFASTIPTMTPAELEVLEPTGEANPHECRACHEEPAVHADRFGLNCARCHTLVAWKPALLTRHVFDLEHGGEGQIACQTCHTESYSVHTCYGCHDHDRQQTEEFHLQENIAKTEIEPCSQCHPTGNVGEADRLRDGNRDILPDGALSQPIDQSQIIAKEQESSAR